MPTCSVCGQAEHKPHDGVLDHCRNCRQPVFVRTEYWVHRNAALLVDHYFCADCITWNLSRDGLEQRARRLMGRGSAR